MSLTLSRARSTSSCSSSLLRRSSEKAIFYGEVEKEKMGHTQYKMAVQPSIVMHWNTVNMANPILSKDVMPLFGPCHRSRQTLLPSLHQLLPCDLASVSLSVLQGTSSSFSLTISSTEIVRCKQFRSYWIVTCLYHINYNRFCVRLQSKIPVQLWRISQWRIKLIILFGVRAPWLLWWTSAPLANLNSLRSINYM